MSTLEIMAIGIPVMVIMAWYADMLWYLVLCALSALAAVAVIIIQAVLRT